MGEQDLSQDKHVPPPSGTLEAEDEVIDNQITYVAGLLAADAERDIPENNDDSRNSGDGDSLQLEEYSRESQISDDIDMAISSDDLPPIRKSFQKSKNKSISRKSTKGVRRKRTVAQKVATELSESDSGTDHETCGTW